MAKKNNSGSGNEQADWYREKDEADWYREKDEADWYREKTGATASSRKWLWSLLISLTVIFLVGGGIIFMVFGNKPAVPLAAVVVATPTPVDLFGPATATASAKATATVQTYLTTLDNAYTTGKAALTAKNYTEAISNLEKVNDLQKQSGQSNYPVTDLLFNAYVEYAAQLWQPNTSFDAFRLGLDYYTKAFYKLDKKDPNVEAQLFIGNRYFNGKNALDTGDWNNAVSALSELYAKTQNFRDGPQLYYNALTQNADDLFAKGNLAVAYSRFVIATRLKNVQDIRYAQVRVAALLEEFKKIGTNPPVVNDP